jgi:serine protease
MKKTRIRFLALASALALPALGLAPTAHGIERGPATKPAYAGSAASASARVIVKYKADGSLSREAIASARGATSAALNPQHASRLSQRLGLGLKDGRVLMPRVQVLHAKGLSSSELAARLAADPDVEYAEPDLKARIAAAPNDPRYASGQATLTPYVGQWYLRAPGEAALTGTLVGSNWQYSQEGSRTVLSAINAEGAWAVATGAGVVVAVLDTGVRLDHPDLSAKLLPGYDFVDEDSPGDYTTANDGNGRDNDPSDPGDWTNAGECSSTDPGSSSSWHGTQVSGLIAATADNAAGIAGAARGARILPVRVLGRCGGYQSDIVAGMRWAAGLAVSGVPANANPAKVVNLSLGSSGSCSATYQSAVTELKNAGVAVVAAAGNEEGVATIQPANCSGAIGVAGIRHIGTKVGYSNVGPTLTVAAPAGNCVLVGDTDPCIYTLATTTNLGTTNPGSNDYSDSYNPTLGTSFATPLVAATVGMMVSANPNLTVTQIQTLLRSTARAFPTSGSDANVPVCHAPNTSTQAECYCTSSTCGAGMLDAAAAVQAAAAGVAPVVNISSTPASPGVGGTIGLDGSGSTVASGRTVASYFWSVTSGGNVASLSSGATSATATLAAAAAGTVTVQLTVTDSAGVSSSKSLSLVVAGPPAPVISLSPASPTAGSTITLGGSGSTPGTGRSITSYSWALTDAGGIATLGGSSGSSTTVSTSAAGSFTVQLTVTDNQGVSASTTRTVTVAAASSNGASGGGGGALGWPWLAALAAAVVALRPRRAA